MAYIQTQDTPTWWWWGGGGTYKKLSWGEGTCLTMGMNKSKTNDKQGK